LTPKHIIDFMNKDGNILLALSGKASTSSAVSSLLLELDIHLANDRSAVVVDHFNYDTLSAAEKHDVLVLQRPGPLRPDVKAFFDGEGVLALPRVAPQTLGGDSALLAPILSAPATAYSYNPKEEMPAPDDILATGSQLNIVSAMQARNSARFTVLGSVESLEDKWFSASVKTPNGKKSSTVNREFAKQLTAWAFKETGVLKVDKVEHRLVTEGAELNPSIYRIKNETVCLPPALSVFEPIINPFPYRSTTLRFPNTSTTSGFHSKFLAKTSSNSSSPCSPPSIAWP
jgi:oligosaccharyltransferase complex subunit beta